MNASRTELHLTTCGDATDDLGGAVTRTVARETDVSHKGVQREQPEVIPGPPNDLPQKIRLYAGPIIAAALSAYWLAR